MTKFIFSNPILDHSQTQVIILTIGIITTLETPTLGRMKRKSNFSTEELHLCLFFQNNHHAMP